MPGAIAAVGAESPSLANLTSIRIRDATIKIRIIRICLRNTRSPIRITARRVRITESWMRITASRCYIAGIEFPIAETEIRNTTNTISIAAHGV